MTTPPVDMHAAPFASQVFLAGGALFLVLSLAWALRDSSRRRTWVPLLALAGGVLASFEEPWIDRLIQLWYPSDAPLVMFTALGIHQPLYLHLYYPGFVGLGAYLTYRGLVRYPDGRMLWPVFAGICVLDLVFEGPSTFFGVYHYYGAQPFQLAAGGWPLWVAPVNAAGPLLGGWLIHLLRPRLTGASTAMVALLPPLAYAGVYGATTWPTTTALNSDVSAPWRWGAGALTMALCVAVVVGIRGMVRSAPAQLSTPSDFAEVAV
ncbi:MAG: hypothetical protein QOD96_1482 [Pseudonocardiales bacterium]|nr:hypothetical protein [Pseudonocardiales bacterium]